MAYRVAGSGPPVMLVHGFLGTSKGWRHVLPLLSAKFTVIAPDMRGYGGSTITESGYDARTLANDFRGLLRHLGHERAHVVGHDMGAPPLLVWAADHPGEILSLTYAEEPVMLDDILSDEISMTLDKAKKGGLWWWMMAYAPGMAERLIAGNERAYIDWYFDNYAAIPGAIDEDARAAYAADLAKPGGIGGWFGVYRAVFETVGQTEPLTKKPLSLPVLGVGGAASMSDHVAEALRRVATSVTGSSIADAGHFIPEEQPKAFADRVSAFINGI